MVKDLPDVKGTPALNVVTLLFFPLCLEVQMYVCNKEVYGFLPVPLKSHSTLRDEVENFMHVQLEVMGECPTWWLIRKGPRRLHCVNSRGKLS